VALEACAIYETATMLSALERDGCVLVRQALSAEQCADARTRIDALRPFHWDEVHCENERGTRFLDRYLCVFNRGAHWLQFLDRPGIIDLAEAALGADCHIIGQTAWRSHPGCVGEPLHVDYSPPVAAAGDLAQPASPAIFILTVQFYLCDVGRDLAPTSIALGSHRPAGAAAESNSSAPSTAVVLAHAGDALVFRSDVWHAGSDNRTAHDVRYLLQVHYARREMAQHFSPYMDWRFAPDVLAAASRRQRRLLGDHEPGAYD
jgi:ectoine hydroxylase-related dioxygenase (phytanoyl-CoA dioxygenase family)